MFGTESKERIPQPAATPCVIQKGLRRYAHRVTVDRDLVNYYMKNPIVFRCVNYIVTSAARVNLSTTSKSTDQKDAIALQSLLQQPNPQQTQVEFLENAYSNYLLTGNAYILAIFDGSRQQPVELRVLRSENMEVLKGKYGRPEGYVHSIDGAKHHISYTTAIDGPPGRIQEVLYLKTYNPADDFVGYSPIAAAIKPIMHMQLFDSYNTKAMDNVWRPTGVFYYTNKMPLTPDEREKLESDLGELVESGDRPILLDNVRWEQLSYPKSPDYEECTVHPAKRIAQVLGVPPSLIGVVEPKFSNYSESRKQFWEDSVTPLVSKFTTAINTWLSPMFGDTKID